MGEGELLAGLFRAAGARHRRTNPSPTLSPTPHPCPNQAHGIGGLALTLTLTLTLALALTRPLVGAAGRRADPSQGGQELRQAEVRDGVRASGSGSGSGLGPGRGGQEHRQAAALARPSRARRSALLSTRATARRPYCLIACVLRPRAGPESAGWRSALLRGVGGYMYMYAAQGTRTEAWARPPQPRPPRRGCRGVPHAGRTAARPSRAFCSGI